MKRGHTALRGDAAAEGGEVPAGGAARAPCCMTFSRELFLQHQFYEPPYGAEIHHATLTTFAEFCVRVDTCETL